LRRWLRLAWIERLPRLTAWLAERLLKPRTADDRKEPKKSYRPEINYLETRFVPNDIVGLLAGAPVFAGGMALTGGFTTPAMVLMRGWGANRPPEPEPPAVASSAATGSMAAKDAAPGGLRVAPWQPAITPGNRPDSVGSAPQANTSSNSTVSQPTKTGDGLQNPLGNDWLNAVDSFFGSTASQGSSSHAPSQTGHAEGGGGGSSGAVVPELGFSGTSAPGTGNAPAAPPAPDATTLASFGAQSSKPNASLSTTLAPSVAPAIPQVIQPAVGIGNGGGGITPTVTAAGAGFGRVPLAFEPNAGQTDPSVQFLSHGPGFSLYLTGASAVFALPLTGQDAGTGIDALRLDFVGANDSPTVIGQNQLTSTSNYFPGTDKSQWHAYVPNYATAAIQNIYPGIDLSFYGTDSRTLEYTFTVHPGANPSAIKLNWEGVTGLSTDAQGNLDLQTADGTVVENAPTVYQDGAGDAPQAASVSTVLNQDGTVGFSVGSYDTTKDLVIDPVIGFSSYLGGSGNDVATGVAVDPSSGNSVVVVGTTTSANFPTTPGVILGSGGGSFVTKLSPKGNSLLYSTYLAGSATSVALDAAGNVYVAGNTTYLGLPVGFLDKLTPSGGQLAYQLNYSAVVTSGDQTFTNAIGVDQYGQAYVAGYTFYSDISGYNYKDIIVDQFSPTGTDLWEADLASGHSNFPNHQAPTEVANAIAVDAQGNSYVTGQVTGVLSTTAGVVQTTFPGANSAFAVKLDKNGAKQYATYLGGNNTTVGTGIAIDINGDAFVTGWTQATNYHTNTGVVQTSLAGTQNAFVTELNPTATTYIYSTYLGGNGTDQANAITVDNAGYSYVVGSTTSTNFPTNNALYSTNAGGTDAFVSRLNPGATTLSYSTYEGGSGTDSANAVALDANYNAFVVGSTTSTNFPVAHAYQGSNAGGTDAFISQVRLIPNVPVFSAISPDTGTSSSDQITSNQNLTLSGTSDASVTVTISRSDIGVIGTTTADGSGNWSFNYSGTTLPEGAYSFTATATSSGFTSPPSQPFVVVVDKTAATVNLTAPATTASKGPSIVVTASDLNGLPDGTTVTVDVDLNNNGSFSDPSETGYTSGTLTGGAATIVLPALPGTGTYPVRVRVNDLAGNQQTSSTTNVVVNTPTSPWIVSSAQVLAADPMTGLAEQQLGDAAINFPVDLDQSPGTAQSDNPAFIYNSDEVASKPVVQFTFPTANSSSLPATISAVLTWNGTAGATLTYSTAGDNPGDVLTMGAQVPTAVTTTGRYNWSLLVLIPGQSNQTINGSAFVVAEDSSPFGAGWTYGPTSQLYSIAASGSYPAGKLRVYGTGGYRFYQGTSSFTSPAGDNGTLSVNGSGWQYQTPDGQTVQFNSSGLETSWTSADRHQALTYTYDGSNRLNTLTSIDGALSTFTYSGSLLQTVKTVNNRTTTFAYSGSNLTSVTNSDAGAHTFSYDGSGRLTGDTWSNLQHQWAYQSNGMLGTYTLGGTGSPTTTSVSPVAAVGLSAAAAGTVLGSLTDALGDKTTWRLDSQGRPLVQTASDGGVTTYTYSNGYVATQTDPLNRTTTYTRDGSGYVISQTNPDGSIVTYQYQSAFHALTTVTNERNYTTTYAYDGQGHQLSQTDALGETTTYTYNATGEQIAVTDPLGHTTTYSYDANRRLSTMTNALGNVTSYTYDANGNPQTTVDALNRTTTTIYDVMGRETGTINALGGRTTMTYLANGLQLSQTDQNGNLQTYAYDSYNRGLLALSVAGSGSTNAVSDTAYFYDNAGRMQMVKDPTGASTTGAYDRVGRLVSSTDAQGNMTQTEYDLAGQTVAARDVLGNWTKYGYNLRGWQTTVTDALGNVTTTGYDASGNKTTVTDPQGHTTTTAYDALNHQASVTDALGHTTTTVYDAAGNTLSTTDPNGNVTSYAYDADNRRTLTIGAYGNTLQQTTTTVYDKVGNTLAVTNPLGETTSYQYDALNRQTVVTDALGNLTTTTYDNAGNVQTVKSPLNQVTSYAYDAQNRQIAVTDPLSHTTTTLYTGLGNSAQTIDPSGHQTVNDFNLLGQSTGSSDALKNLTQSVLNAAGNVQSSTDADGNVTTYLYDALARQYEMIDPTGGIATTVYDSAGRVLSTTEPNGNVTSYAYDSSNRKVKEIDAYGTPLAVTKTILYDAAGNVLSQTTGQSSTLAYDHHATTSYTYDSLNRQVAVIEGYGTSAASTTTTVYDTNGNVLSTSDPVGDVTSYAYDSNNRRIKKINGFGTAVASTTTMIYDAQGNLLSQTTGLSTTTAYDQHATTSYVYDSANRRIAEIDGYNSSTQRTVTTVYDTNGNILAAVDGRGTTTMYAYDADSRRIAETDANGTALQRTTTTVYDAAGQVIKTIDSLGYATTYVYDGLRRQIAVQTPAGGTATTVYDHNGNVIAQIDQLGHATSYSYDALNRKVTETDALNYVTTYAYDAARNQVSLTDADGNTTTMVYDVLNRLVQQTDPLNHTATFAYDAAGRQTSSTDRLGRVRNVSYDALNHETSETWISSGSTVNIQTFTYDAAGNKLTAADYNGAYTMAYDALNRMTSEQEPFGQALTFTYDADDNRTVVQDSQGGTTTSVYDVLNRLTTRKFGGPGQTTLREDLTYTVRDQIATEQRYSDLAGTQAAGSVSYTYDPAMRLTQITDLYANGTALASYVYNYDQASRLTSEVDNGTTTSYSYNTDNELTGSGSTAYSYDATGNRISTGYVTGPGNQLLSDGTSTYTYDAEGNRLTKRDGSDITTYTYDNRNRLVGELETVGGTLQAHVTYVYDVFGNRLETDDYSGGVTTVTRLAYDQQNAWEDLSNGNVLLVRRLYLDDSDQMLARLSASGAAAWYDTDHLGSVKDVVNYAGTMVLDQIAFDAYGNKTSETSPANGDRYGYTGREWDPASNLQYNRARCYDPDTGTWLSQDPLGANVTGPNLYQYVENRPTTYLDPSGQELLAGQTKYISLSKGGSNYAASYDPSSLDPLVRQHGASIFLPFVHLGRVTAVSPVTVTQSLTGQELTGMYISYDGTAASQVNFIQYFYASVAIVTPLGFRANYDCTVTVPTDDGSITASVPWSPHWYLDNGNGSTPYYQDQFLGSPVGGSPATPRLAWMFDDPTAASSLASRAYDLHESEMWAGSWVDAEVTFKTLVVLQNKIIATVLWTDEATASFAHRPYYNGTYWVNWRKSVSGDSYGICEVCSGFDDRWGLDLQDASDQAGLNLW
jgi:RHS repeat-associated protein